MLDLGSLLRGFTPGSSQPGGAADVSPRGDAPGFVQVVDDTTLLIPDRPDHYLPWLAAFTYFDDLREAGWKPPAHVRCASKGCNYWHVVR